MTVNRERKIVPMQQCCFDVKSDLSDILKVVTNLIEEYGPTAYIDGCTDAYSDSDYESFYVYTMIPESDEQYNTRISYEEKREKVREDRDAAEFKRLSEKFGEKK